MSGYWANLFVEEKSSWTDTLADVCQAVVSYGLEVPWCVCHTSNTVLSYLREHIVSFLLAVSSFLNLEAWWRLEYTVVLAVVLIKAPYIRSRAQGSLVSAFNQMVFLFTFLFWLGCFLEMASALQGGIIFGGKLYYPALALLALVCQCMRLVCQIVDRELYGYGPFDPSARDPKVARVINTMAKNMRYNAFFFFCLAAYGLPRVEGDFGESVDLSSWFCLIPLLTCMNEVHGYYFPAAAEAEGEDEAEEKEKEEKEAPVVANNANGDVVAKASVEAAPEEKDDDTASPTAADAKTEKVCFFKTTAARAACLAHRLLAAALACSNCAQAYVLALPWAQIIKLTLIWTNQVLSVYTMWMLTEDVFAVGVMCCLLVLPTATAKMFPDLTDVRRCLMTEAGTLGAAATQYYIYKTYITQAYY